MKTNPSVELTDRQIIADTDEKTSGTALHCRGSPKNFVPRFRGKTVTVKEKGLHYVPDDILSDIDVIKANLSTNKIELLPEKIGQLSSRCLTREPEVPQYHG